CFRWGISCLIRRRRAGRERCSSYGCSGRERWRRGWCRCRICSSWDGIRLKQVVTERKAPLIRLALHASHLLPLGEKGGADCAAGDKGGLQAETAPPV